MRILVGGDSHGSTTYMRALFEKAQEYGCDSVFIVGDYGYYPLMGPGMDFLDECTRLCNLFNMPLFWLDGNHEDFGTLQRMHKGLSIHDNFIEVRPSIFYSPRGHVFEWDGVRFMTVGGAFSINRIDMKLGEDWFLEEELTLREARRAMSRGKVDIMLTHDAPKRSNVFDYTPWCKTIEGAKMGRNLVDQIVDTAQPSLLIHGHYHVPYRENHGQLTIRGLAHNKWQGSINDCFWIIDTKDYK